MPTTAAAAALLSRRRLIGSLDERQELRFGQFFLRIGKAEICEYIAAARSHLHSGWMSVGHPSQSVLADDGAGECWVASMAEGRPGDGNVRALIPVAHHDVSGG